jgi:sterol desaturase/sphingolipid hydroxylase (fatty acid hydroxylase superfamily)
VPLNQQIIANSADQLRPSSELPARAISRKIETHESMLLLTGLLGILLAATIFERGGINLRKLIIVAIPRGEAAVADLLRIAFLLMPSLLAGIALQLWFPLEHEGPVLSRGFAMDLGWYIGEALRRSGLYAVVIGAMLWLRQCVMGHDLLAGYPYWAVLTFAVVIGDLLAYLSHRARHRFDLLWQFHAIHHSQQELNFFSEHRFHDLDVIFDLGARLFPLVLLSPQLVDAGIVAGISILHFRLYHCPIRTNYGPLRHLLVSPQFHRIHHARDSRLSNSNFGVIFSIWDRAFGTEHESADYYPDDLGVADSDFPVEQAAVLTALPRIYAAQLLYPFAKILRDWRETSGDRSARGRVRRYSTAAAKL